MTRRRAGLSRVVHHLLLGALFLPQAAPFQQHSRSVFPVSNYGRIAKESTSSKTALFSGNDTSTPSSKREQHHSVSVLPVIPMPMVLMSAALGLFLCGTPQMASAAELADLSTTASSSLLVLEETTSTSSTGSTGMSASNYFGKVFNSNSPYQTPGATPLPTDPKLDNAAARNRAYDQAFEQDARDRDAYYGRMAMQKREQALQTVQENRRALGLDGDGDVRPRVGMEKEKGMSSLKEYLLEQDPEKLTPAELKVYQQMQDQNNDGGQ